MILDEQYDWAIARRGWTYLLTGHYQEALTGLDRAISLNEKEEANFSNHLPGDFYGELDCLPHLRRLIIRARGHALPIG